MRRGLTVAVAVAGLALAGCRSKNNGNEVSPTKLDGDPLTQAKRDAIPAAKPAKVPVDEPELAQDPQQRWRSGSRLVALVHDGGDGATRFSSFWDQELKIRCTFAKTGQGWACLPLAESPTAVFSDASCETPVHETTGQACGEVAKGDLLRRREVDPCGASFGAVRVSNEANEAQVWSREIRSGTCLGGAGRKARAYDVEPVELSTFVKADLVHESYEGALEIEVFEAEDGARLVHGVKLKDGPSCTEHGVEPDRHCVPEDSLYISEVEFINDTCDERAVVWYPPLAEGCPEPSKPFVATLATNNGEFNCYGHEVHEIKRELKPTEVFAQQGAECKKTISPGRFFLAGDVIDTDALPRFDDVTLGTGKVVHVATTELGQSRPLLEPDRWVGVERGHWLDEARKSNCLPERTIDGEVRCLPERSVEVSDKLYMDDKCKKPVAVHRDDPCNEPGPEVTLIVKRTKGCDPRVYAAHEPAPFNGELYWIARDECVKRPQAPGEMVFAPGKDVPLSTFPEIVEKLGR